jgi:hypothetical protein
MVFFIITSSKVCYLFSGNPAILFIRTRWLCVPALRRVYLFGNAFAAGPCQRLFTHCFLSFLTSLTGSLPVFYLLLEFVVCRERLFSNPTLSFCRKGSKLHATRFFLK